MATRRFVNPLLFPTLCALLLSSFSLMLVSCDKPPDDKHAIVRIAGKTFTLELALNDETRFRGLSDRTEIKPDGGMLFVFTDADTQVQRFVMRDCPIPIDIIYLDKSGRVTATHKMVPEPPRTAEEKINTPPKDRGGREYPNEPRWKWTNDAYESRLKHYSSKYAAQFVIELKGNTLDTLKVKEGDKVELDIQGLKKRAQ